MADLTRSVFNTKWNNNFRDNNIENITEETFREFKDDLLDTLAAKRSLTTNSIRGGLYRIPNVDALGTIPEGMLVLNMEAMAVNGTGAAETAAGVLVDPVYFKLVPSALGTLEASVSEDPDALDTIWCVWVRVSGTQDEKIRSYPVLPTEDQALGKGEVYQYTFENGDTRLVEVKQDISGAFYNPLPTGENDDPYYTSFAPLSAEKAVAQPVQIDLLDALDVTQGAVPSTFLVGLLYEITGRNGLPVRLRAVASRSLELADAYEQQPGPVSDWAPVQFDLVNDMTSARQGGGTAGWGFLPYSVNDASTIPNYVSQRLLSYATNSSPRLLPQAAGVLAWRDGVPAGYFATLAAAADYCYQLDQAGTATVLFQVYGTVGTATTNQYVKQSATVQLMAGSRLVAALFACQYSNEYQGKRTIRLVGEGELVANLDNYAFGAGLRLEVECAKWTGQLHHNTGGSYPRCEYWFRGVKISSKGAPTALLKYRYGNYYQTNAFVWLDGCTVENTDSDLLVVQGTNNGTGAGPGETDGNNLLRLTKTTVYLAAGKVVANQAAGTVTVEQPAEGGAGSPAPAFFIAANEYNTTPAHPAFTSAEAAARWMLQYWNSSGGTVPPPAAPPLLTQDDTANYIEWQKDSSLAASAYEVTMDAGDSWAPANSGTVVNGRIRVSVSSGQVGIGVVGLRLKATTSTPASAWSFNSRAFDFADYLRNSRFQDGDNGSWQKGSGAADITISTAGVVFAAGSSLAEISQSLPGNTFENGKNYVLVVEGSGTGSFRLLANVDYGGWAPSSLDFQLSSGSARLEMTLTNNAQHNSYYYLQRLSGGGTITRLSLLATA